MRSQSLIYAWQYTLQVVRSLDAYCYIVHRVHARVPLILYFVFGITENMNQRSI